MGKGKEKEKLITRLKPLQLPVFGWLTHDYPHLFFGESRGVERIKKQLRKWKLREIKRLTQESNS